MKHLILYISVSISIISCKNQTSKDSTMVEQSHTKDHITSTQTNTAPEIAKKIATANGFDQWNSINEIQFTFNVDSDKRHFERSWTWKPKQKLVTLIQNKDTITYNQTKVDSTALQADQGFINDKYWLLAPFQLIWDSANYQHSLEENAKAPMSGEKLKKFTIVYQNNGGYTPGDAYDFYFDNDYIIKEWVFREKNTQEPSLITSWEDYEIYNGIKVCKTHQKKTDSGNGWSLYFTNIAFK